jgi:2-(3-amino-3-carboxypropyl)histidine synthase
MQSFESRRDSWVYVSKIAGRHWNDYVSYFLKLLAIETFSYLGDGRFHLESIMIQNPSVPAFKYDPYSRILTREEYGFDLMVQNRQKAVDAARNSEVIGLIQGTLGRQGNIKIFEVIQIQLYN